MSLVTRQRYKFKHISIGIRIKQDENHEELRWFYNKSTFNTFQLRIMWCAIQYIIINLSKAKFSHEKAYKPSFTNGFDVQHNR